MLKVMARLNFVAKVELSLQEEILPVLIRNRECDDDPIPANVLTKKF